MHRPWILLGASFGLLTPAMARAQPAGEAPAAKAGAAKDEQAAGQPAQPKTSAPAPKAPTGGTKEQPATPSPAAAPEAAPGAEPPPADAAEAVSAEAADAPSPDSQAAPAPPSQPPPPAPVPDDEEPELPMTPPAPDTLGGHFVVSAGTGFVNPYGRYGKGLPDRAGWGWLVDGNAGFGVSRSVVVGAWGQYQDLPGHSACSECKATSWALGPFVRFHLVQGLRFDPWMSFSVGYRKTALERGPDDLDGSGGVNSGDFAGFDWARVRVGGDWYAFKSLGFGPFLELTSGGFSSRPPGAGGLRTHWHFAAGLRLVLDIPGKP